MHYRGGLFYSARGRVVIFLFFVLEKKTLQLLGQIFGNNYKNQNLIHEEIKRRLNLGNACYHSIQNILSSRLLFKSMKIRIYKTIILPLVLYGCEAWSLTSREEHRLRVFENRVLRRIFGPRRDEVTGDWRKMHNEELVLFPNHN
jgi:hypothetical protein